MFKLVLEKAEEPEIKLPTSAVSWKKQESSRKTSKDENTRPPDLPPKKSVCRSRSKLELDMEQQTGSKSGKEYIKAVYCHLAHLTYMQSSSCEMLDWIEHKLDQDCWKKYQ